ncbi:MAG: hypothetical protein AAF614_00885 [Chloroflexota bacterium]
MPKFALTKQLSRGGRLGRTLLKRFIYTQMAMRSAFMIAIGREKPLLPFTVEQDPPSVYWVFCIKETEVAGLAAKLELPPRFSLCPIRCLTTDEPAHLLTLNVYRVSGLANGIRAEWSVYVHDGDNVPRYMVVDARSSQMSMDPVDIITKSSTVLHERVNDTIRTQVGDSPTAFTCTMTIPSPAPPLVTAAAEWVTANDFIYWGNGICDRTFYGVGLANARQRRWDSEGAVIQDLTPWGELIEPDPVHILVFDEAIEFVVSPWENVDGAPVQ